MTGISSQLLLLRNLIILHTFREYPAKLEKIKDFQRRWEYLAISRLLELQEIWIPGLLEISHNAYLQLYRSNICEQ
jgi:hypothetical protein